MTTSQIIVRNIHQHTTNQGRTIEDLAAGLATTEHDVRRVLAGLRPLTIEEVFTAATWLDVPVDSLARP